MKRIGFACKWLNDPSEVGGMKVKILPALLYTNRLNNLRCFRLLQTILGIKCLDTYV